MLCDLEGLTHEEAAGRLGWPVGTVKSRQSRGRNRLRERLKRRGFAPLSGGVAAMLATAKGNAAVPESLAATTVKMALLVARGSAVAAIGSTATILLTRGTLRAMFLSRIRIAAMVGLLLGGVVTTTGLAIHSVRKCKTHQSQNGCAGSDSNAKARFEPKRSHLPALQFADIPDKKRRSTFQTMRWPCSANCGAGTQARCAASR